MRKIAVEPGLTPVKELLSNKGYSVESIDMLNEPSKIQNKYDAIVVSGMASNFLGIHDTDTNAVVINASGMTPEQVCHEIETRLQ